MPESTIARSTWNVIHALVPQAKFMGILAARPAGSSSDHPAGLALDIGGERSVRVRVADMLIGAEFVRYVIHLRTIWVASKGWIATPYNDGGKHNDHVHVSFKPQFRDYSVERK
jgi:hypothetical protein